jgi:hypothetical protein
LLAVRPIVKLTSAIIVTVFLIGSTGQLASTLSTVILARLHAYTKQSKKMRIGGFDFLNVELFASIFGGFNCIDKNLVYFCRPLKITACGS